MKKALLALFAIATVTAASAFAADKTDVPAPVIDNGVRPPMEMDRGPLPPFPPQLPPHRPVLFSATVATDTPAETINKLTALIPAGQAKHYEVHVKVDGFNFGSFVVAVIGALVVLFIYRKVRS